MVPEEVFEIIGSNSNNLESLANLKMLVSVSYTHLDVYKRQDLHVEVTPVNFDELSSSREAEKSSKIRERVMQARTIQDKRFEDNDALHFNAQMSPNMVRQICVIDENGQILIKRAMEKLGLSARAYDRILKVARTIADLANSVSIDCLLYTSRCV